MIYTDCPLFLWKPPMERAPRRDGCVVLGSMLFDMVERVSGQHFPPTFRDKWSCAVSVNLTKSAGED